MLRYACPRLSPYLPRTGTAIGTATEVIACAASTKERWQRVGVYEIEESLFVVGTQNVDFGECFLCEPRLDHRPNHGEGRGSIYDYQLSKPVNDRDQTRALQDIKLLHFGIIILRDLQGAPCQGLHLPELAEAVCWVRRDRNYLSMIHTQSLSNPRL